MMSSLGCLSKTQQPGMARIDLRLRRQGITRMQVEGNVERLHHLPEWPVLRQVVIDARARIVYLRKAVDESSSESQLADAAIQLPAGKIGILHRQRRQRLKSIRTLAHLLCQKIIRAPCNFARFARIRDRLDG